MNERLPRDPVMLLSVVNARLRDYYDSLEDFCKAEDVEESWVVNTISPINYFYNPSSNQFE